MRTIKFRAVHYTYEGVFDGFSYWGRINNKYESIDDYSMFMGPSSWSGSIIKAEEQFTGLLDKNGVEIYENDVVEWKHAEQEKEDKFYTEKRKVYFHQGSFGFERWYNDNEGNLKERRIHHPRHHATPDLYYIDFDIEVIGNIHENPELTK